ncbi:MAG TPA: DUF3016 domain-containing protein [Dokdonella sp.]|uniref:DUF3016 domain-containing protein n=1 Tax=Dokdonella sp. TaxID=2291710 RepID=UPI002D7E2C5E|nr:DUF3016 domain-containing protein [Dokdonella sp.]HET9034419.1 DUF3016 domain-containing protein [Dokdonella sp.]
MNRSTSIRRLLRGLLIGALVSCISIPAFAADVANKDYNSDQVSVSWTDPAKFTEMQFGNQFRQPEPEVWLTEFQKTLVKRGDKLLQPGQHLDVVITNVKLAGRIEPGTLGNASGVRVVKSIYPPEVSLNFKLTDSQGQVIDSGERNLRDVAFLDRGTANHNTPYRFETRLLKDWLNREFGKRSGS